MLIDCVDAGKKSQGSIDPSLFPSQVVVDPVMPLCNLKFTKYCCFLKSHKEVFIQIWKKTTPNKSILLIYRKILKNTCSYNSFVNI